MEFENQIKQLASEIYEKVVNFINDNKDSDDMLYECAYLTLSNGVQIMFGFKNGSLYITQPDVQRYSLTIPYEVKISNEDTEYRINNIKYETSLSEKINRTKDDSLKHIYEINLKKQQQLTEEEKENIKKYYELLNKLIDNMSYNDKKTHNADNYNYETDEVYNEYMYKKELNKLNETQDKILPAVKVAVDWWAKIICAELRGGSIGNDADSKIFMTGFDLAYPKQSLSNDQISMFKETLAKKIMDKIYESNDVIQMLCDYAPDRLLYESMMESNINPIRTPFKTNMYIRAYWVEVKEGYGARDVTLFDSTEECDLENIKNICRRNIKNEQQKVLSKKI